MIRQGFGIASLALLVFCRDLQVVAWAPPTTSATGFGARVHTRAVFLAGPSFPNTHISLPSRRNGQHRTSLLQLRSSVVDSDDALSGTASDGGGPSSSSAGFVEKSDGTKAYRYMNQHVMDMDYDEIKRKFVNFVILAASFGYAAYTIFNVDKSMSRGWTQSEIALRIPLDTWSSYEASLEDSPVYTKTLINVVIYLLGDWLSQTVFKGRNILDFDAGRTMRNGFIGLCFGPLVHQYYQFSDAILPVEGGIWNRVQKIMMDQTIYLTVKCSVYIMAVGLLQGDDFKTAKQSVQDRIGNVVFTAWKFWPLVHCITYSVIPAQHRILWVNSVDLVWNAILASMSQQKESEPEDVPDTALEVEQVVQESLSAGTLGVVTSDAGPVDPAHFSKHSSSTPEKIFDDLQEVVDSDDDATPSAVTNNATVAVAA